MSAPRLLAPTTISGGIPTAGAGTANTIALWTPDNFTLGNSLLTQSGNIVTNASGAIRANGTTQTSPAFMRHDATTSGIYFPATNEIGFTISNQHAMFISSGRNVGIGTVSPSDRLQIGAPTGTAPFGIIIGENYGAASQRARLAFGDANRGIGLTSGDNVLIHTFNTNSILFGHGSTTSFTERARIDSAGNFSLGANPTTGNRIVMGGIGSGTSYIKGNEGVVQVGNIFAGPVQILTADTPQVTVTGTGNVGIGTASPTANLHVYKASGVGATVESGSGTVAIPLSLVSPANTLSMNNRGDISFSLLDSSAYQLGIRTLAAQPIFFATNGLERARIDSSGRLLVGTSAAPSSAEIRQLVAPGTGANGGQQWAAPTAGGAAITPIATNGGAIFYRYSGSVSGETYVERFNFSSTAIQFKDGANLLASIDNSGNVTLPFGGSTVNVSTTNAGIKLPATPGNADAQTLDCYQENPLATTAGNGWTPTLSAAATWGGTQPTVDYARYIRIGSLVFCEVRLSGAALTSTIGSTTISMPPATINSFATESTVQVCATGANNGVGICNSTTVFLPTLGSSSLIRLSWFYFTTS